VIYARILPVLFVATIAGTAVYAILRENGYPKDAPGAGLGTFALLVAAWLWWRGKTQE
jgi:peptidoglycan/LPS O-acetylase OafA/YrhL